jgi:capsular exopolysaccharide synthesis family protein
MQRPNHSSLDSEFFGRGFGIGGGGPEFQMLGALFKAIIRARYIIGLSFIAGAIAAFLYAQTLDTLYTASARIMIDTRARPENAFSAAIPGLPTTITALESELEVMNSLDLVERVVERANLDRDAEFSAPDAEEDDNGFRGPRALIRHWIGDEGSEAPVDATLEDELAREEVILAVSKRRAVSQSGAMSAAFAFSFTSQNRMKAADIANAFAEEYLAQQVESKLGALEDSSAWLKSQTEDLSARLAELNTELETTLANAPYTSESDLESARRSKRLNDRQLDEAVGELTTFNLTLTRISGLAKAGELQNAAALFPEPSPQLAAALSGATPPDEARLRSLIERELSLLESRRDATAARVSELNRAIAEIDARLADQAAFSSKVRLLESELRTLETVYVDFVSQLTIRQQGEAITPDASIIERARPPLRPSEPSVSKLTAVGAVLVAFLATVLALIKDFFQNRLRTVRDFEEATNLPVLGIAPKSVSRNHLRRVIHAGEELRDDTLVKNLRRLRANINTVPGYQDRRVIAVVSALAGEGKSTTLFLLGKLNAASGRKTLIIDFDFWRSPFAAEQKDESPEFEEILRKTSLLNDLVKEYEGGNLHVLPAPRLPDNPVDMVNSNHFKQFFQRMKQKYDVILIDLPPILPVVDMAPVAGVADATLMVVKWNATSRNAVQSALRVLADVGVEPMGLVVTMLQPNRAKSYSEDIFSYSSEKYQGY